MSNLLSDELQLERLKLKLAIHKYLKKWSKQYAVTLKQQLRCDKLGLFNEMVDELAAEPIFAKFPEPLSGVKSADHHERGRKTFSYHLGVTETRSGVQPHLCNRRSVSSGDRSFC